MHTTTDIPNEWKKSSKLRSPTILLPIQLPRKHSADEYSRIMLNINGEILVKRVGTSSSLKECMMLNNEFIYRRSYETNSGIILC